MKMHSKTQIKELFENRFNKEEFVRFTHNLLNEVVPSSSFAPLRGTYIKVPFQNGIHEYERVCKYLDLNGKQIDVLIVKLKDKNKLENARTFQRNFVVDYLNGGRGGNLKDGALVAFYSDESPDWRFSFVKLEYELKTENGKIKEEKKMSSAKRYSFLVGQNENSHTAQSQLLPILEDDTHNPRLEDLEKVFSVETVTNEFFEKYKSLFNEVKEYLDKILETDSNVRKDFIDKDINTVDFAKKLLGQIVFLYFLQKKGWFGVEKGKLWGTGSKRFLRDLFDGKVIRYTNFFNEVLEPLFYEALATDRSAYDHFSSHFNSRIPFLNGGLFDPIGNYDWINTDIVIPNELFSNQYISQDKHKDIGTGILDVFDRYNFTVREDEPLEKEVAIDPEMLGKVFENMLEVKDRKSKGTYYTPREIVHYMCQESLINYLESNLENVAHDDIEYLIKKAELDKQKEEASELGSKKYSDTYPASIKSNFQRIDTLLADIKVCDPAIGSGAFPVGMMNEIVKARSNLNQFFTDQTQRTEYEFKRHAIAESLHGVDIDAGAVEIAKLRLWLSLIVDEDDIANIKPLPNLDYKIMQGNSLIEEYEGIKLFDDSLLQVTDTKEVEIESLKKKQTELQKKFFELYNVSSKKLEADKVNEELTNIQKRLVMLSKPTTKESVQADLFMNRNEATEKSDKLLSLQKKFFESAGKSEKTRLKNEIDNLIWELIEVTVKQEGKTEKLNELNKLRKSNTKPFFLWKLNFADVFREKGGFDVVIGNPPYVKEYTSKSTFDGLRESEYYMGKMDLWYFFGCIGLDLLKDQGIQTFIAPNNWVSNYGAKLLRKKILKESKIVQFIDFGNYKVFDTAGIQTMVYVIKKVRVVLDYQIEYAKLKLEKPTSSELIHFIESNFKHITNSYEKYKVNLDLQSYDGEDIQFLNKADLDIVSKIKLKGTFCLNDNEVAQGIVIPQDFLSRQNQNKLGTGFVVNEGIFVLSKDEKRHLELSASENELIKPYFTTSEFYRYGASSKNKYWIIYTDSRFSNAKAIEQYPNIKKHLDRFKSIITSDNKPYGLHRARNDRFFIGEKIISTRKCIEPTFSYTDFDCYVSATFYILKTDRINMKYLTAILNSQVLKYWLKIKGKMQGNNYQIDKYPILNIPICNNLNSQKDILTLVDQILSITSSPDYDPKNPPARQKELEREIDQLVYKLYELTPEEIKIVEEATKGI